MARGKKTGGRQKGTPNKDNALVREKLTQLLSAYSLEKMIKDLNALESKERLTITGSLAEFVIPKLQRSEVKSEAEITVQQSMVIGGQKIIF